MKRLVLCCDGTWQQLTNPYPTNVVKIAQAIKPVASDRTPQVVFYGEGIGTEDRLGKLTGGAFGWGIDTNIQDAYRFLCLNYDEGDEIYLFGFSRGAYTVRSLAGLIAYSGLLSRPNIRIAPEAYKMYRRRDIDPNHPEARNFRSSYGEQVPIKLLGCWDTVGSLGVPDQIPFLPLDEWINQKYKFHNTTLSEIVQHARHAVAIDEIRKVFDVTPMEQKNPHPQKQTLRQVWFPGAHGCVGGGSKECRGLSDGALQWMIDEAAQLGLEVDLTCVEDGIIPDHTIDFNNELEFPYQLTGKILRDITGNFEDLHESTKKRWRDVSKYRPKNLVNKYEKELNNWALQNLANNLVDLHDRRF